MWQVSIMLESDAPFTVIGELRFPADEPLTLEWEEESKEQPIVGSVATLTLLSPGDRTYENLYSIAVGKIRMDVYRNGRLYWSGALDPEFYEEPYAAERDYEVSLTFSDFGILDRLNYDLSGMKTLREVVLYSLGRSMINYGALDERFISTSLSAAGQAMSLSDLKVRSDNFYDEDGEPLSLRRVLEGILQPLALRLEQRSGRIWVYDLNGLYRKASAKRLRWASDDQTLGVDTVYNNAKITWSPYAQSGILSDGECWTEETDPNLTTLNALNILDGKTDGRSTYYSYHHSTDVRDWCDATDSGFTLWTSSTGKGLDYLADAARYFKIVPQYDGSESEGIAIYWRSVTGMNTITDIAGGFAYFDYREHGVPLATLKGPDSVGLWSIGDVLFKSTPVWIPPVENEGELSLRIAIDLLMDPRSNPYESAANLSLGVEQKDWYSQFNAYGNFIYVPVVIKFQPDGSDTVYIWSNRDIVKETVGRPVTTLNDTYGRWDTYTGESEYEYAWGYLCYYDAKDHTGTSGVLGWKKNRSAINPHERDLISILRNAEDGQYIPYPNYGGGGGKLWVEVCSGAWIIADAGTDLYLSEGKNRANLWDKISWVLMKLPEIEIMNRRQFDKAIDTDDVEYSAQLNGAAKEPIEIDTICGTSVDGVPTARGAYFNTSDGKQITQLTRAGRTTQAEELLIGTLYSQFADRRTKLTGTVELEDDAALAIYTEAMQGDKLFLMTGVIEDVQDGTGEATFVELRPDEYDKEK